MKGWTIHEGAMLALPLDNIDTDQLIPARFMSVPRADGYGKYLLYDLRFDTGGRVIPDMPLNRHKGASILVTGRNFGCGSSREAAVYALVDAGFRAVIAPGFGDIFAANAVNNGLLPAQVPQQSVAELTGMLAGKTRSARISLTDMKITLNGRDIAFELDPVWRTKLVNGWDDIDLTRAESTLIKDFQLRRKQEIPWAWPVE